MTRVLTQILRIKRIKSEIAEICSARLKPPLGERSIAGNICFYPKNLIWTLVAQLNADFSDTCTFLPFTDQVRFYKWRAAEKNLCDPPFIRAICVNN